jgi:hypothetical protein
MFRDLSEGFGGGLSVGLEERTFSGQTLLDDFLSSLDDELSVVVLFGFLSPFSISDFLSSIEVFDLLVKEGSESLLVLKELDLLVSDGDLFVEFSLEFLGSLLGISNLLFELGDFIITFVLNLFDVGIISILFSFDVVFNII